MRDTWKQASPIDQHVAIRSGLEGSLMNAADGIAVAKSLADALRLCQELADLEPYLARDSHAWKE